MMPTSSAGWLHPAGCGGREICQAPFGALACKMLELAYAYWIDAAAGAASRVDVRHQSCPESYH
jgi:hypothetical protein